MAEHDPGDTLRAAQIQAVRQVLLDGEEDPINDLAAAVVDAMLAAGGLCGHTSESLLLGHPPLVCTMPAGHLGQWHGDANGSRWTPLVDQLPTAPTSEWTDTAVSRLRKAAIAYLIRNHLVDLAAGKLSPDDLAAEIAERVIAYDEHKRGYDAAVANLRDRARYLAWRDDEIRWDCTQPTHHADYLQAVGPGGEGRIIAYIHRAADGTETTFDPAEIWTVRQAAGPGTDETA